MVKGGEANTWQSGEPEERGVKWTHGEEVSREEKGVERTHGKDEYHVRW